MNPLISLSKTFSLYSLIDSQHSNVLSQSPSLQFSFHLNLSSKKLQKVLKTQAGKGDESSKKFVLNRDLYLLWTTKFYHFISIFCSFLVKFYFILIYFVSFLFLEKNHFRKIRKSKGKKRKKRKGRKEKEKKGFQCTHAIILHGVKDEFCSGHFRNPFHSFLFFSFFP